MVSLLKSIPGITWLSVLVMINFYLFAVIGTNIFGDKFPEFFGSIGKSSFTLFQIMTLESWSMGIARSIAAEFEYAYTYFIVFILINTFVMLNLFVGILVNAMSTMEAEEEEYQRSKNDMEGEKLLSKNKSEENSTIEQIAVIKELLRLADDTIEQLEKKLKEKNQRKIKTHHGLPL